MAFNVQEFRNHITKYNEFAKADKFDVTLNIPSFINDIKRPFGFPIESRELALQCEVSELPSRTIQTVDYVHYGFTERLPHYTSYDPITMVFYCNGELSEKKFFDFWLDSLIPSNSGLVRYRYENGNEQLKKTTEITIKQYSQVGYINGTLIPPEESTLGSRIQDIVEEKIKDIGASAIEKISGSTFGQIRNLARQIPGVGQIFEPEFVSQSEDVVTGKPRAVYECTLIDAMPIAVSALPLSWADDSILRLQVTFVYKKWKSKELFPKTNRNTDTNSNYEEPSLLEKGIEGVTGAAVDAAGDWILRSL